MLSQTDNQKVTEVRTHTTLCVFEMREPEVT